MHDEEKKEDEGFLGKISAAAQQASDFLFGRAALKKVTGEGVKGKGAAVTEERYVLPDYVKNAALQQAQLERERAEAAEREKGRKKGLGKKIAARELERYKKK